MPIPSYLENLKPATRDGLEEVHSKYRNRTLSSENIEAAKRGYRLLCLDKKATNGIIYSSMCLVGAKWYRDAIGQTTAEILPKVIEKNDFEKAAFIIASIATDLKEQAHHISTECFLEAFNGIGNCLIVCVRQLEIQKTPESVADFNRLLRYHRSLICSAISVDRWIEGIEEEAFLKVVNAVGRVPIKTDQTDAYWTNIFSALQKYPSVLMRIDPSILDQRAEELTQRFIVSGDSSALQYLMTYYKISDREPSLQKKLLDLLPSIGRKCEEIQDIAEVRLFIQEVVQRSPRFLTAFNSQRSVALPPLQHYNFKALSPT